MAPIDYPAKTSEWDKVLIDTMNSIVIRIDKEMTSINNKMSSIITDNMSSINDNISTQFQTFREDLLVKVDEIRLLLIVLSFWLRKMNSLPKKSVMI